MGFGQAEEPVGDIGELPVSVPFLDEGDGFGECFIDVIVCASVKDPTVMARRGEHFRGGVEAELVASVHDGAAEPLSVPATYGVVV